MYLTYDEYREYGGMLDETTFTEFAFEAQAQIDWHTFNRLQKEESVNDAVKRCMYKLIAIIQNVADFQTNVPSTEHQQNNSNNIISQSNDGVSVRYNKLGASDYVTFAKEEVRRAINIYLQGVTNSLGQKVLYKGIYPNE